MPLVPIEGPSAAHLLAIAIRAAEKQRGYPSHGIMGDLILWCGVTVDELRERQAAIVRLTEVIEFPSPPKRTAPAYLHEAGLAPHVSTREIREHAFAAYAAGMAHGGPEAAFDAAVTETLRRTGNWTEAAAAAHTKRFVVPAYERAFPRQSHSF